MENLISWRPSLLWIAVSTLFTVGCGTLPGFQIAIDSIPQGARVEINNEYIGQTPTTLSIAGNADRSFNGSWVQGPAIQFVSTPPFGQTRAFSIKL